MSDWPFPLRTGLKGSKMGLNDQTMPDMPNVAASWAVYTRHQHEKLLAEMLSLKGFQVFLPLYDSTRRWKDRKKVISLPLFPCYLFVRGCLEQKLQILTTPGVSMILHRGSQVAIIPENEIEALQRAIHGSNLVEPHPYLKCGMRVRVTRGSLEGVEGLLTRKKNLYRLILSVEMLAQSVAVEVDAADVEPCGTAVAGSTLNPPSLTGVRVA